MIASQTQLHRWAKFHVPSHKNDSMQSCSGSTQIMLSMFITLVPRVHYIVLAAKGVARDWAQEARPPPQSKCCFKFLG